MSGHHPTTVAAAGICAVILVATAAAANSASFGDPTGDTSRSPDVSGVSISSDDAGVVTVRVSLADRTTVGENEDVGIGIDADQNPDSGGFFYGTDFELGLINGRATFLRPDVDGDYYEREPPAPFEATSGGGVATFSFDASKFGVSSGFNLYAYGFVTGSLDAAPDIRTFNYQLVPGTRPPPLLPDQRAPVTEAYKSVGVHGKVAKLFYSAADGRGETADTIRVYRGKRILKRIDTDLLDTAPFFTYHVTWRIPKKVRGKLYFCVYSVDRAGNKGNTSCAAFTVR